MAAKLKYKTRYCEKIFIFLRRFGNQVFSNLEKVLLGANCFSQNGKRI
jgi:hypothetical protein